MTAPYTKQVDAFAREVQYLVEIDLDRCTRTYGTAPCTASVLADGSRCSYSYTTCQDVANYAKAARTYRFSSITGKWPDPATFALPLLRSVLVLSQRIDPDQLVTLPEQVELDFAPDWSPPAVDADKGSGKYNTAWNGEFWRNLVARNPNYPGRKVRLFRGFGATGFVLADFERIGPEYVIRQIQITDSGCRITVESPLVKLNDRTIPTAVSQKNVLQSSVVAGDGTLSVWDADEFMDPTAYSLNEIYVQVENEIMRVTARDTGADTLTVSRGQAGTTAASHAAGEKVESIAIIGQDNTTAAPTGITVSAFLRSALEYIGIATADIDTDSFDALATQYWAAPECVLTITKPTRASQILAKIREPRGILLYISPAGKWTAKVMAPPDSMVTLSDTDFIAAALGRSSLTRDEDDESRITRASLWYDPSKEGSTTPADYLRGLAYIDWDLENANAYGEPKEQAILDAGLDPALPPIRAANLARRLITRKRAGIRRFTGEVELKKAASIGIGDGVLLTTDLVLGPTGTSEPRPCIVTGRKDTAPGRVWLELTDTNFGGRYLRIAADTTTEDYDSATEDERQQYGFWGDANNRVGAQLVPGYIVW